MKYAADPQEESDTALSIIAQLVPAGPYTRDEARTEFLRAVRRKASLVLSTLYSEVLPAYQTLLKRLDSSEVQAELREFQRVASERFAKGMGPPGWLPTTEAYRRNGLDVYLTTWKTLCLAYLKNCIGICGSLMSSG